MNSEEFCFAAVTMAEFIANYRDNIEQCRVLPEVSPGYLGPQIPLLPPTNPEKISDIMMDMEKIIMPGITHWQHPHFFAYFPSAASYPSILATMIAGAIGSNGTSWTACPAATELETVTTDWLARALGIPKFFIFSEPESIGGGILLTSASEANLLSILAARRQALEYLREQSAYTVGHDSILLPSLVAYCSSETHSSVEKAAMIALIKLRVLDVDDNSSLRGRTLQKAIDADVAKGLHPFIVITTLGSTGCTALANLMEIGPVVQKLPMCWLHCDGAYGGNSFICPELREPMAGLEYADSFNVNPNKWLLINCECSTLWVKDRSKLERALVDDVLHHVQKVGSEPIVEYRHWGVPLGRKFNSLKVWMTLRTYGIKGIQNNIRNHCHLAKYFAELVETDERFEVLNKVKLGLVCFRMRQSDDLNRNLLDVLNSSGLIHLIPSIVKGKYAIRLAVGNEEANEQHIEFAWSTIKETANKVQQAYAEGACPRVSACMSFIKELTKEMFERRRGRLPDFSTPIDILEDPSNRISQNQNTQRGIDVEINDDATGEDDDDEILQAFEKYCDSISAGSSQE